MLQNTTPETTEEYKTRKRIANKTIRREKRSMEKKLLESLEKTTTTQENFSKNESS